MERRPSERCLWHQAASDYPDASGSLSRVWFPQPIKQHMPRVSTKMCTIVRCIIVHIGQDHAMNLRKKFGLNLQRLRRERRLSQEQLAHLAGCARAYLSGAEAGRRNSTLDMLEALATVLEVEPADLLKDPETRPEPR